MVEMEGFFTADELRAIVDARAEALNCLYSEKMAEMGAACTALNKATAETAEKFCATRPSKQEEELRAKVDALQESLDIFVQVATSQAARDKVAQDKACARESTSSAASAPVTRARRFRAADSATASAAASAAAKSGAGTPGKRPRPSAEVSSFTC
jgi:hypothetical protein